MADPRIMCGCGVEALPDRLSQRLVAGIFHRYGKPCYPVGGSKAAGVPRSATESEIIARGLEAVERARAAVEDTLARWRDPVDGRLELRSGRAITSHLGILGLSACEREGGKLFHGYDGESEILARRTYFPIEDLTPDERAEIAAAMAELWRRWAAEPGRNVDNSVDSVEGGQG